MFCSTTPMTAVPQTPGQGTALTPQTNDNEQETAKGITPGTCQGEKYVLGETDSSRT
ncbi:hypothetical protein KUS72_005151 [Escherichia coli]|nr:hypothetical protein [Escherichia coli]EHR8987811.1 hypothetical protein [Escherichia coli]EHR9219899.1 hypothetical protein [Escherichia coli]EIM2921359.1 hypothetical protein [Escherichia coli]EIM2940548.1 hypothetical protein [Escherichia coli]